MYQFSIYPQTDTDPAYGIANLELKDGCFDYPLAQMSGRRLEIVRNKLIADRSRIVLYTLSMPLSDYDAYLKAFRAAHLLRIENIKICLCTLRGATEQTWQELARIIELGEDAGIRILFEPKAEYDYFTDESYRSIRSDATGLIFNPAEYVKQGKNPFLHVLYKSKFKHDVVFVRINDRLKDGDFVLPGAGNAEIKECVSGLLVQNFRGYFSFSGYPKDADVEIEDVINRFTLILMEM